MFDRESRKSSAERIWQTRVRASTLALSATTALLLVGRRRLAHLVEPADVDPLTTLGEHVLLDKRRQLSLLGEHRQERADKLVVVVRTTTVVNLCIEQSQITSCNRYMQLVRLF